MKYYQEREEALLLAKEKIAEAAETLEEILPDAAEELGWLKENLREEILSVRAERVESADAPRERKCFDF